MKDTALEGKLGEEYMELLGTIFETFCKCMLISKQNFMKMKKKGKK